MIAIAREDWREALSRLDALVTSATDELCLEQARAYRQVGELERSIAIVERYIAAGGELGEAGLLLAELWAERGDVELARTRVEEIVREEYGRIDETTAAKLTTACCRVGLFELAEHVLEHVTNGHLSPDVLVARLEMLYASKRWQAIVDSDYDAWLPLIPGGRRRRCELLVVRALIETGETDAALARIRQLRAVSPDSSETLRAEAEALQSARRWADAAELWRLHLTRYPGRNTQLVRTRLAFALERLGEREESNRLLAECARVNVLERLQSDPEDREAYAQLIQLMTAKS